MSQETLQIAGIYIHNAPFRLDLKYNFEAYCIRTIPVQDQDEPKRHPFPTYEEHQPLP